MLGFDDDQSYEWPSLSMDLPLDGNDDGCLTSDNPHKGEENLFLSESSPCFYEQPLDLDIPDEILGVPVVPEPEVELAPQEEVKECPCCKQEIAASFHSHVSECFLKNKALPSRPPSKASLESRIRSVRRKALKLDLHKRIGLMESLRRLSQGNEDSSNLNSNSRKFEELLISLLYYNPPQQPERVQQQPQRRRQQPHQPQPFLQPAEIMGPPPAKRHRSSQKAGNMNLKVSVSQLPRIQQENHTPPLNPSIDPVVYQKMYNHNHPISATNAYDSMANYPPSAKRKRNIVQALQFDQQFEQYQQLQYHQQQHFYPGVY